jgi:hypothetical protein
MNMEIQHYNRLKVVLVTGTWISEKMNRNLELFHAG